ncbi:PEP-CTERM sorting domain-containing protein [Dechloromonas sp. A34]|uniref:PEP-CTERM sorting domain-containing protein n=1 Tax=Dechloromonas sp. A34 TaxID=447588 RepID=UPI0022489911|nr:PEP-CTERM sorting domain-containing protein [Dechloromonas sp. A34]
MKKVLRKGILVAATCLASLSAPANAVMIAETGLGNGLATGGLVLPIAAGSANYWAGLQTLLIDNSKSLLAFCIDPWEWSSSANQSYGSNSLESIFGQPKASFIRELYSEAYSSTLLPGSQGNLNAAAFQLALWEIVADDNPTIAGLQSNLNNGLVRKVPGTNGSLLGATNSLLNHIDGVFGSENYSFDLYVSGRSAGQVGAAAFQDFLVVNQLPEPGIASLNQIPEPAMASLMLTALGGLGLVGLRRRKQSVQISG